MRLPHATPDLSAHFLSSQNYHVPFDQITHPHDSLLISVFMSAVFEINAALMCPGAFLRRNGIYTVSLLNCRLSVSLRSNVVSVVCTVLLIRGPKGDLFTGKKRERERLVELTG